MTRRRKQTFALLALALGLALGSVFFKMALTPRYGDGWTEEDLARAPGAVAVVGDLFSQIMPSKAREARETPATAPGKK